MLALQRAPCVSLTPQELYNVFLLVARNPLSAYHHAIIIATVLAVDFDISVVVDDELAQAITFARSISYLESYAVPAGSTARGVEVASPKSFFNLHVY